MQIYAIKNGQKLGPYTRPEIMSRLKSGEYTGTDLAWFQGCSGAVPLSHIMNHPVIVPTRSSRTTPADAELVYLAIKQKVVIWLAVAWVGLGLMPMWPEIAGPLMLAFYAVHITGIVFCLLIAKALRKNIWLWGLLALVPLLNLFAYANMVSQAAKTLKVNGIATGLFGANRRELDRIKMRGN